MQDIKEIGKVILVREFDEKSRFHESRKIQINDREYKIVPLYFGDYLKDEFVDEAKIEKITQETKEALLKEVEKYIEYQVIHHADLGTVGIKLGLVVIAAEGGESKNDRDTDS